MNRLLNISEWFVLLCGKLNSGSEGYLSYGGERYFFMDENISSLVSLKITNDQKYLLRRTRKVLNLG